MAVSREALFEEVWAEPMLTVAARYGVSSNFLARVCERLNGGANARERFSSWVPPEESGAPTADDE
jgi:hypothetical protein